MNFRQGLKDINKMDTFTDYLKTFLEQMSPSYYGKSPFSELDPDGDVEVPEKTIEDLEAMMYYKNLHQIGLRILSQKEAVITMEQQQELLFFFQKEEEYEICGLINTIDVNQEK